MRSFLAAILLTALTACSLVGLGDDSKTLEIVEAGIFKNGVLTLGGTGIPLEKGLTFGMRFKYASTKAGPVKATITINTPGLINPDKNAVDLEYVSQITLEPGRTYDAVFTFSRSWEMASGHWTITVETQKGDTITMLFDAYEMVR